MPPAPFPPAIGSSATVTAQTTKVAMSTRKAAVYPTRETTTPAEANPATMASERPVIESEFAQARRSSPTISGIELRNATMKSVPHAPITTETAISAPVSRPSGARMSRSITAPCPIFAHSITLFALNRARRLPTTSPATNPEASRTAMNNPMASARPSSRRRRD